MKYIIDRSSQVAVIWYEQNGVRTSFTSKDENNTDYQAYLAWVAEGNTAEEWNPQG